MNKQERAFAREWAFRMLRPRRHYLSFFEELKRRNVFRVGIAYGVVAWVLLQIADLVIDNIVAPDWVMHVLMLLVGLG